MLDKFVAQYVSENLQWFFDKYLKDHYNRRRATLLEHGKRHELKQELIPIIDYVLKTSIGPEAHYPPETLNLWHEYYHKLSSGYSQVFKQLLVIYLKHDLASYLSIRERESTTGRQTRTKDKHELEYLNTTLDKLSSIPQTLDFKTSIVKMSTGFWALDNDQAALMLSCLSDPFIDFSNHFESPRDLTHLIVATLYSTDNQRLALHMHRTHRYDGWGDEYDELYCRLLIHSRNLSEALKYERMFGDQENHQDILRTFIEMCSKFDLTKALNRLHLSIEEESALNELITDVQSPVNISMSQSRSHHGHRQSTTTPSASHPLNTSFGQQNISRESVGMATPRNRNVQLFRKKSFNDSPAKNTRLAKKKKAIESTQK